jgi:hypothetical protein
MQIKPVLGAMGAMRLRNPRPHREKSRSPLRWGLGSRPPVGEVRSGSNGDLADPAGVSPLLPPKPDISALATYVSNGPTPEVVGAAYITLYAAGLWLSVPRVGGEHGFCRIFEL